MNEFFIGFNWTLLLDTLNTQECWDLFTDKEDYAIEKFIPINDKISIQVKTGLTISCPEVP